MTGDSIIVVAGLAIPPVIRGVRNGTVEIVGECYVHGYTDGEDVESVTHKRYKDFAIL